MFSGYQVRSALIFVTHLFCFSLDAVAFLSFGRCIMFNVVKSYSSSCSCA